MSEIHRYKAVNLLSEDGNRIAYKPSGPEVVKASDYDQLKAQNEALRKDIESHKRMLLVAACDVGAIGEALGADMDDDGSEIEGLAKELRKDAERYRWLRQRQIPLDGHDFLSTQEILDRRIDAAIAKELP